jgi:hypothetical protein
MRKLIYLILFLVIAGCSCPDCGSSIVSDAQITFLAQGREYRIVDREGPTIIRMSASYNNSDSSLNIFGQGDDGIIAFAGSTLPFPSKQYGLPDTGSLLLDLTNSVFLYPNGRSSSLLAGGALVTIAGTNFYTDSKHTGFLRITNVDTLYHVFSGTFNFLAFDTIHGDTLRIDSGIISKMRIN